MPRDVYLLNLPRILSEIVREIVAPEPDLTVVEGNGASQSVQGGGAGVAITILADPIRTSLATLLGPRAQLRVIALSDDGRQGTAYDIELRQWPLGRGELSPAALRAAIRQPFSDSLVPPPDGESLTGAEPGR